MRKSLLITCAFVFLIASATEAFSQAAATQTTKTLQVPGLQDQVTVRRDERGIPYIEAKNHHDLYFAQGYVTASDRLWQMDLFRRNGRGQLAEIFGAAVLEEDKRHRTFGFAQVAEAEAAGASAQVKGLLDAYAAGVNAYIASLDAKSLPPEFQLLQYKPTPWTPADSLIVIKNFFETLSSSWRLDVMREGLADLPPAKRAALLPETSKLDVLVVGSDAAQKSSSTKSMPRTHLPPQILEALASDAELEARSLARLGLHAENLAASNNWVVSGKHTASGKPLLSNDPHLTASAPPIWYLVQLSVRGMRVAGVTAAGVPGIIIGHNEYIAWGFTNVGTDVQDVYIEKFDPQNPKRYLTPSGWRDAEIRHEEIKVRKGFGDNSTNIVPLDVTVTRHGPIVLEREGRRYALRWTALDPTLNPATVYQELNRSQNWKEVVEALHFYNGPMQNMVFADVAGHIGYYAPGKVPMRKSGDGSVPYDGSTDDGEWTSYIPFDKLPHVYEPASGIIVTANQRIIGKDYPYFLTHSWAQPYRANRILEMIKQKPKLTADDFRAILGDVYTRAGDNFAKAVVKTLKGQLASPADDQLSETVNAFEKWDARLNADSKVGPIAAQMRLAFRTRIVNAAIGEDRARAFGWGNFDTTLDWILAEQPADWLPKDFKNYAELLRACYADARAVLTKSLGADDSMWIWGNMVKARFPHPMASAPLVGLQFAIPPFPQNGTGALLGATVNVGSAVSMRLIADPGDWDKTQHGITTGESGIANSPHWTDQLEDWRAVTPRVFPFTEAAIAKATKETVILEPQK
ncbi:MAG TPA: penicillin acylase family protein [Pyrinomonadaceae bacterium]|nr:penicillin acylase family protein [Pyrinomonadaceae bacterium]